MKIMIYKDERQKKIDYSKIANFKQFIDLKDVVDSMMLDSSQVVAEATIDGIEISLEVRGDVKVAFNPNGIGNGTDDIYRTYSEMPEELKDLIKSGEVFESDKVYIDDNNWFEIFWNKDGYWHSDVIDAEKSTADDIKRIMLDVYDSCIKESAA